MLTASGLNLSCTLDPKVMSTVCDQKNNEFWQWFNSFAYPRLGIRSKSFKIILEYLDKFKNPLIIETGCTGDIDTEGDSLWKGHGCSTLIFDKYVSLNDGCLLSVDSDPVRVENIKKYISEKSHIYCDDSINFLKNLSSNDKSPQLVYLDSYDFNWHVENEAKKSQAHHLNELMVILPKLTPDTLVVVDDSPLVQYGKDYVIGGKGSLISQYAHGVGTSLYFSHYQSAWLGFNISTKKSD